MGNVRGDEGLAGGRVLIGRRLLTVADVSDLELNFVAQLQQLLLGVAKLLRVRVEGVVAELLLDVGRLDVLAELRGLALFSVLDVSEGEEKGAIRLQVCLLGLEERIGDLCAALLQPLAHDEEARVEELAHQLRAVRSCVAVRNGTVVVKRLLVESGVERGVLDAALLVLHLRLHPSLDLLMALELELADELQKGLNLRPRLRLPAHQIFDDGVGRVAVLVGLGEHQLLGLIDLLLQLVQPRQVPLAGLLQRSRLGFELRDGGLTLRIVGVADGNVDAHLI